MAEMIVVGAFNIVRTLVSDDLQKTFGAGFSSNKGNCSAALLVLEITAAEVFGLPHMHLSFFIKMFDICRWVYTKMVRRKQD
ncbi:MAG: hypothetical protein QM689_03180 [Oscillospiraceae bacterium]